MTLPLFLKRALVRSGVARLLPAAKRLADGGTDYLHYYSDRVLAAPLADLRDPAFLPAAPGDDVIDLNQPTPRLGTPPGLGRVATDGDGRPSARGRADLRETLADLYRRRDGRDLDPETDLLVTHGATAAYAAALDAFVNPGDRVVLFDPCSPVFAVGAKSRRARVRWVPTWNEDGRCRFPAAGLEQAMRGAKLLVLANPNNPTGGCLSADDCEQIADIAGRRDVLVYLDESFARFGPAEPCPLATLPGADRRTLSAGSVAAGYGLGGVRVGWLAGPRHLVKACTLTASLSAPFVPTACQEAAARALANADSPREAFAARRRYVLDRLRGVGLEPDVPAGGYFAWVPVAPLGLDGRAFAERLLREQRVLVGPGCAFGPTAGGHVRLSFAGDDGRVREGLARLTAFVEGLNEPAAEPPAAEAAEPEPAAEAVDAPRPVFSRV